MIRRRLVVIGHVQNVVYRAWFAERARSLGLDGWVRNRADGSVEAVVQGPAEAVGEMVTLAHQGSAASRVANVETHDDAPAETLAGFEQRPTL